MSAQLVDDNLHSACAVLFGAPAAWPRALQGDDWRRVLRAAFRRRALESHPDRAALLGRPVQQLMEEFQSLASAYELLQRLPALHLPVRPQAAPPEPRPAARAERSASPPTSPPPSNARDHVYQGMVPGRRLRLSEYLYYSGRVSFLTHLQALAWQQHQGPLLGQLGVQLGYLEQPQVRAVLESRRRLGLWREPFGEHAVRGGLLNSMQLLALLGRQRRMRPLIGRYYLERKLLDLAELDLARMELYRHNSRWRNG